MSRKLLTRIGVVAIAISVGFDWTPSPLDTSDTAVGPPWISLEIPANPLDRTTRDAALLVHVYHHEHPAGYTVSGTAEGLVDGERRTVELDFVPTSRRNVYALTRQWTARGDWVLKIGIEQHALATLLVELGSDGGVESDTYYGQPIKRLALRSVEVVAGAVNADRIDAVLERLSRSD